MDRRRTIVRIRNGNGFRVASSHRSNRVVEGDWIFWSFVYVLCGSLCLWQVALSLSRYVNQPIVSRVETIAFEAFKRPSFTLCRSVDERAVRGEISRICDQVSECRRRKNESRPWEDFPWSELRLTAEDVWKTVAKTRYVPEYTIVRTFCSYAVRRDECESAEGESTEDVVSFDSVFGQCLDIVQREDFYYSPESAQLHSVFPHLTEMDDYLPMHFYLHWNDLQLKHDLVLKSVIYSMAQKISFTVITITEFHRLDTKTQPCSSEAQVAKEYDDCVNEKLSDELPCGLPFVESNRRPCANASDFFSALEKAKDFYRQLKLGEECPKKTSCHEITHTSVPPIVEKFAYFYLNIRIRSNLKTVVTQAFAFDIWQLWSEISGNLSFFLGLSFLASLKLTKMRKKVKKFESKKPRTKLSRRLIFDGTFRAISLLRALLIISFVSFCIWQLSVYVARFFQHSVKTQVRLIESKYVEYPSITMCPTRRMRAFLHELLERMCPGKKSTCMALPFSALNSSLDDIAVTLGVSPFEMSPMTIPCAYASDERRCEESLRAKTLVRFSDKLRLVPLGGRCTTLTHEGRFLWRGDSNVKLSITIGKRLSLVTVPPLSENWTIVSFRPHTRDIDYRYAHFLNSEEITIFNKKPYDCRVLLLSIREIRRIDAPNAPCLSEEAAIKEYNACMDRKLEAIIPCRLLHVNSSQLPSCEAPVDFEAAFNASEEMRFKDRSCKLKRVCDETIFNMMLTNKYSSTDDATFSLESINNRKELLAESYEYTASTLFTDVSNSLGFCLEFSLLNIISCGINTLLGALFAKFLSK